MARLIKYRPDRKVMITKGLFAGEVGLLDEVSRDGKHFKLIGRDTWYPSHILKPVQKLKYYRTTSVKKH